MGQSTVVEWLNENEFRAYPLTTESVNTISVGAETVSLHRLLLDANIVFVEDDLPAAVELTSLSSDGSDLVFTISGDNTSAFTLADAASATYPAYVRNSQGSLLVFSDEAKKLVSTVGTTELETVATFEPSVLSEFRGPLRGVNSLAFNGTALVGAINLIEGYQTDINVTPEHTLGISVGASEGIPIGCQNFFEGELENDCGTVVSWVNGATPLENGGGLRLVAGSNIRIFEDKENHRIYIGLSFTEDEMCPVGQLPPV